MESQKKAKNLLLQSKISILFSSIILYGMILLFFTASCNSRYLHNEPLPDKNIPLSKQISYILQTDQQDRRSNYLRFMLFRSSKHISKVARRDSVRCNYLLKLITDSIVVSSEDKFNCGLIFMHGDGNVDCSDTIPLFLSTQYFLSLKTNPKNKGDSLNGITWYKLSYDRYSGLLKKCRK